MFFFLSTLLKGNLVYLGPVDLTVYFIKNMDMKSLRVDDGTLGIQISITMGRRLLGVFLTTYLPTFLLLVIVHATHYFKPFFFEAIVTVNLTCTLIPYPSLKVVIILLVAIVFLCICLITGIFEQPCL